jgi:hypothetical protein
MASLEEYYDIMSKNSMALSEEFREEGRKISATF